VRQVGQSCRQRKEVQPTPSCHKGLWHHPHTEGQQTPPACALRQRHSHKLREFGTGEGGKPAALLGLDSVLGWDPPAGAQPLTLTLSPSTPVLPLTLILSARNFSNDAISMMESPTGLLRW
jgi:hypothetical protein